MVRTVCGTCSNDMILIPSVVFWFPISRCFVITFFSVCDPLGTIDRCVIVKSVVTLSYQNGADASEIRRVVVEGFNEAMENGSFYSAIPQWNGKKAIHNIGYIPWCFLCFLSFTSVNLSVSSCSLCLFNYCYYCEYYLRHVSIQLTAFKNEFTLLKR